MGPDKTWRAGCHRAAGIAAGRDRRSALCSRIARFRRLSRRHRSRHQSSRSRRRKAFPPIRQVTRPRRAQWSRKSHRRSRVSTGDAGSFGTRSVAGRGIQRRQRIARRAFPIRHAGRPSAAPVNADTADAPQTEKPPGTSSAARNPSTAHQANRDRAQYAEDADLGFRQRQGKEDLRAPGLRAPVQRAGDHRASGPASRHARFHGAVLLGRSSRTSAGMSFRFPARRQVRGHAHRPSAEASTVTCRPTRRRRKRPRKRSARIKIPQDIIDRISD